MKHFSAVIDVAIPLALFAGVFAGFGYLTGDWRVTTYDAGSLWQIARTPLLAMLAGWVAASSWAWWRTNSRPGVALLPFAFALFWLGYLLLTGLGNLYISHSLEQVGASTVTESPAELWQQYQASRLPREAYLKQCKAAVIRDYLRNGQTGHCPDPEHPGRNLDLRAALSAASQNNKRYGAIVTHYLVSGWIYVNSAGLAAAVMLALAGLSLVRRRRRAAP